MLVFFLWGITLSPLEVCAGTHSLPGSKSGRKDIGSKGSDLLVRNPGSDGAYEPGKGQDEIAEGVTDESVEARSERGYVDMDSEGMGDRFVDEDGDGIDDRRMMRHRKRNRKQWDRGHQRGNVGENGESGHGAYQRQQSGPGMGGK